VTFFGQRRLIGMRRSYYYLTQADHARRLADMTIQPNVEEILRRVADELDHLAHDVAAGETGSRDLENTEVTQSAVSLSAWLVNHYARRIP
jgi:hypothetical protein